MIPESREWDARIGWQLEKKADNFKQINVII